MTDSRATSLEERYGRGRERRVDRRLAIIIVAILLSIGLAVVFFGTWRQSSQIDYRDLSYTVIDDRNVSVSYEISVDPGTPVVCTLEALSASHGQAGWLVVEIPPSDQRTRQFTQTFVTTVRATTALAKGCWIEELD